MSHKFEINITLRVNSSQDVVAQHLEGGLRLVQSEISDVVLNLLPKIYKERKNAPEFHCENVLVKVDDATS